MTPTTISPANNNVPVMRLLFGLLGVCFLIAAGILAHQRVGFVRAASSAEGTAIQSGFGPAHPDIKFTTSAGRLVTFSQGGAVRISAGAHVKVLYDPARPQETA
ncbi:MAG: DUF3592 domain-containing protein, partial [Acidocella sp.]|nr:DUF3592 domain-containing protein [Acidocella sp.]